MASATTATSRPTSTNWWGTFSLAEGELGRWRIGPLDLWVRRTALEWRYGAARGDEVVHSGLDVQVPATDAADDLPPELSRFGCASTTAEFEILPALADRPVVARPAVPFFVPPGETIEVFVSSPLWVRLRVAGTNLFDIHSTRPSDTWFGSNTQGELSYATRTLLRRDLTEIPLRPHRAVSSVKIENASEQVLPVERLSLPVLQLSLFAAPTGTLWTEQVSVRTEAEDRLAEVFLGEAGVSGGTLVCTPREPRDKSFASLVLGGLFEH